MNYPMSLHAGCWLACLALLRGLPGTACGASVSHVIQISVDSLGGKYLGFYLTNAPTQFPNLRRLQTEGACTFNARSDFDSTETVPNHCTIVTSRPVLQPAGQPNTVHHGYNNNLPGASDTIHANGNPNLPYKASVLDVVHDRGLSTAFLSGKSRLSICARSYNATNSAPDTLDEDNGRDKIDRVMIQDTGGSNLVDVLITDLNTAPRTYTFLHLNDADSTGHSSGWGSAAWSNAVRQVDEQLGRILAVISTNQILSNQTAIVLAADHGGGGLTSRTHNEPEYLTNYTIPFFVWGPGIPAGTDAYLLFANRADPGTNRLDYNAVPQPLRDGDAANLSLALLGLPTIPGSSLIPVFASSNTSLAITRSAEGLSVSWPEVAQAYTLELAEVVSSAGQWQKITDGISTNGTQLTFTLTNTAGMQNRFFRLRRN
jgi:hypothetical protein